MNTILPKFVDFNSRTSFYKTNSTYMPDNKTSTIVLVCVVIVAVSILLTIVINVNAANAGWDENDSSTTEDSSVEDFSAILTGAVAMAIVCGAAFYINKTQTKNVDTNRYYATGFHIANTNLMASTYSVKSNKNPSGNLDPRKNYHLANYYVYVDLINPQPKGIKAKYTISQTPIGLPMVQTIYGGWGVNGKHLDNDNKMSIIYLGQMKNGKFIPNYRNAKVVKIFMDYQKFIKTQQLENKFKHHFSFEVSHDYTTKNQDPVLVVVGDNGFTLHYKNDKITKNSDIIASEGS